MIFLEKYNNGQTILVDKDLDWTSFDVVKKLRNIINANNVFLSVIRAVYTICIFYPRNKLYLISLLVLKNGYKYENF